MIDFCLKENELIGPKSKKFRAQVINSRSYTFDDIAKHLLKHNTGLSSSVIYGLWEGIKDAVEEYISDGGSINTELFRVRPSIKGVFNNMEDGFDASRHKIKLNLRPGRLLKDIPEKLRVRKLNSSSKAFILSVTDIKTGSVNEVLTPGKNIKIIGQSVKIDGNNPTNGLYFIPEKASEQPVKIELSEFVMNNPSQIIAVIPKLNKGIWNVRLVTQYCKGKNCLKKPQSVTFEKSLNVA